MMLMLGAFEVGDIALALCAVCDPHGLEGPEDADDVSVVGFHARQERERPPHQPKLGAEGIPWVTG